MVYPQWRDQERLPFPLLNVFQALIGESEERGDRLLPGIFYSRVFWIACIAVFLIHGFRGLSVFTGGNFPSFPLDWDLADYFTDGIMSFAGGALRRQYIFFAVVGVAYFIPSRYAISIWAWVLGYAVYGMVGSAYIPAFRAGQSDGQAFGALIAIAVWILWLGRSHWYRVGQAMFGKAESTAENRRNAIAGWMFSVGFLGIVLWLNWAGASLWWSLLAAIGCAIVSLLMARIIAETGVPIFWLGRVSIGSLTSFFPLAWQSPIILFMVSAFYSFMTRTTAVSASVMSTLAMGLERESRPSRQSRMLVGGDNRVVGRVCGLWRRTPAYGI